MRHRIQQVSVKALAMELNVTPVRGTINFGLGWECGRANMSGRSVRFIVLLAIVLPISSLAQVTRDDAPPKSPLGPIESGTVGDTTAPSCPVACQKGPDVVEGNEYLPPVWGYRLKVTDTLLSVFTLLLFLATLALWLATRALVKSADKNAERQLRAYVTVQSCRIETYEVDKTAAIIIVVRNSGQTPSHGTTILSALKYREVSDSGELKLEQPDSLSSTSIGSDGTQTVKLISSSLLTRDQSMAIANGKARLIVHGQITYKTVFGEVARTDFRFHFNQACVRRGDNVLHAAAEGNNST